MEVKTLQSAVRPNSIEKLGNGSYYYNYNIQPRLVEVTKELDSTETVEETNYFFVQVHLTGVPNYKDCVQAVIRAYVTQNQEFDLINSANKVVMGLSENTEDTEKYKEYLQLVNDIKVNVKKDFE